MTQKELNYVEDAILHEQNLMTILEDSTNQLEDEELISFLQEEIKKHQGLHQKIMKLLEDNINE